MSFVPVRNPSSQNVYAELTTSPWITTTSVLFRWFSCVTIPLLTFFSWLGTVICFPPESSQGYILIQLIVILTRKDFPRWKCVIVPPFSSGNGRFPEIKITTGPEHTPPHHSSWRSTPSLPPCWPVHVFPHTDIHMHEAFSVHSRPAQDLSVIQYGDLLYLFF